MAANWVIEDSMLAPRDKIEINYKGPNPFAIYKRLDSSFFQRTFEVGSTDTWEREFRWTEGNDPHPFFIRIFVRRKFDANTIGYFEILMQGNQPSDPSKNGDVRISLGGNLRTQFELDSAFRQTAIFRGLVWLYFKTYYSGVRRGYLKICQEKINLLNKLIREWTGLPEG